MNKMSIEFGDGSEDKERKDGINVRNLRRLGEYVRDEVSDEMFDMGLYMNDCGSVGCLLGWAERLEGMDSLDYINGYNAIAFELYNMGRGSGKEHEFLFSSNWVDVDNSRIGALRRIRFVMDNDGYDYGEVDYIRWYRLYTPAA